MNKNLQLRGIAVEFYVLETVGYCEERGWALGKGLGEWQGEKGLVVCYEKGGLEIDWGYLYEIELFLAWVLLVTDELVFGGIEGNNKQSFFCIKYNKNNIILFCDEDFIPTLASENTAKMTILNLHIIFLFEAKLRCLSNLNLTDIKEAALLIQIEKQKSIFWVAQGNNIKIANRQRKRSMGIDQFNILVILNSQNMFEFNYWFNWEIIVYF